MTTCRSSLLVFPPSCGATWSPRWHQVEHHPAASQAAPGFFLVRAGVEQNPGPGKASRQREAKRQVCRLRNYRMHWR
jgi:hypothetical protein